LSVAIRFLGTAAFEIVTAKNKRVLIDPFLDENPVSPIKVADLDYLDLLVVTHAAYDHLGDTLAIMQKFPNLLLMCGADVRGYLIKQGIEEERLVASPWGMMVEIAGVRIRPVYCRHWSYIQDEDGIAYSSTPLAFILYADNGCGIYNAADTALYGDMKLYGELYKPKIGLFNIGVPSQHLGAKHGVKEYLTGEMDAKEGALAAEWWGVRYAIPCHHDNPSLPEIVKFKQLLEQRRLSKATVARPIILAPGESFEI
jgi:L-ascorbate metabolism protein UlaG (beta-lactamase superfamily)